MKGPKDDFQKYILASVGLHIVLYTVLVINLSLFSGKAPEYQRAVRVDIVALPDKLKPQVPIKEKAKKPKKLPVPKKKKPKVAKKPPKKKKPKKIVEKKPDPKKEQDVAMKKIQERLKNRKKDEEQQEVQKVEYKGNELSKGQSFEGLQKLQHESYLGDLDSHIKNFWQLPQWLADEDFKAIVILVIGRRGQIKSKNFILRSGNDSFDQYVNDTLDKAAPLPPPPADLARSYATRGIEIRFPE